MKKIIFIVLVTICNLMFADSKISMFLKNSKSIKADFIQTSISGTKITKTDGWFEILRPNNFKWVYVLNNQEIVGNGVKIYVYDKDLSQVTIRSFDNGLDRSPAFLLAGGNQIDKYYNVKNLLIKDDNLLWEEIVPKDKVNNNGFKAMLIGFDANARIKEFKFEDEFSNKVTLELRNLQTNKSISSDEFKFKIPQGVDVLE